MFKCPYCNTTTNSLKRKPFPDWYHVAKHVKACKDKTGEYIIDPVIGPIHYSELLPEATKSNDYFRYKHPGVYYTTGYIRNHFKKFGIDIPVLSNSWDKEELISTIKDFVLDNDRIPTNRDFGGVYPSMTPFLRIFGSWSKAIEAAGYDPNTNLYGITNKALDNNNYRSLLESSFVNKFLFNNFEYVYEPRYPHPHRLIYDFYIASLDLYIELAGGTSESYINNTNKKIEINKILDRNLLVVYNNDIDRFSTLEELINGSQTYYRRHTRS